ncbi:hypothetical protein CBW46_005250 [Paenibacillus xerothermodurans]|uniref:Uncharacterized protein n=1 Tax=Paenibacillus xerothermodurans TaxID=1977292 RepID=A0A2W1NU59_PAEXE|nr:hypothetical protein CBW46_005250 [Paenibacillus xerothermodurans]
MMILVPIFLFCALLIDFARLKVAEKESENAVKAGVRSTLSAFSPGLQQYGLYALDQGDEKTKEMFVKTVSENMSGSVAAEHFGFIDQRVEPSNTSITSMYSLANHMVLKKQILEEMKYRAPMIYSLEIADKFKKTGLATNLRQASDYSKNAVKIEALLDERNGHLDRAWREWKNIHAKAAAVHPFYQSHLAELNELSARVGIHTVAEVRQSLTAAKADLTELKQQLEKTNDKIADLIAAGNASAAALGRLRDTKDALKTQMSDLTDKISALDQLLEDVIKYTELLAMLKLKSTGDLSDLKAHLTAFDEAINKAKTANDQLNTELRTVQTQNASTGAYKPNEVFQSIDIIQRQELDEYGSEAASVVALFSGLQAQLGSVLLFDAQNYQNADGAIQSFWQKANDLFVRQGQKESQRTNKQTAANSSKSEQRQKAQPYLDQVTRVMGVCSLVNAADPFKEHYTALQGDPAAGSTGFYQAYMTLNKSTDMAQPVPEINVEDADKAGASAMNLVASLEGLLTEVRDEFYVDEYAISKFSYRTLGLEKDASGQAKQSKELSQPESHALVNQELEYLLYGASSCAGNYAAAYAEMFAFRLAVGTAEALTEPHIQAMNVGSPLAMLLAAVAEGAMQAHMDMTKLIDGEAVPLSKKLGSAISLSYKDYLRVFLLLHSRDAVMLSRLQALIQLNTGTSLEHGTTYLSGTAASSVKLWFLPSVMKLLGASGLYSCQVVSDRCHMTKTGVMAY